MFDEQILGEIVRKRLNLNSAIDVLWTIPEALERLSRKIAANPKKRQLLLTNSEAAHNLVGGAVELSDVPELLGEFITHGEVWYKNVDDEIYPYPAQALKNKAFLNAPKTFGNDYYHYYLENDRVVLRNLDINQPDLPEGFLIFNCPRRATIADVGAKPELQELLIEKVIELLSGSQNDAAEDGEN